ncbi:hypothetical protein [Microtetraspora malaysiensis]|uniref:HlyD family efflux transporter periplasmic adaptor subunit n=1 Tax=Microtetraspora malaysiensis TaxID=161358 RepID=A0ABW6SLY3_9ACTN
MTRAAAEKAPVTESPGGERIDQLVSAIRIRAWLAVLALGLVAASGAAWAWFGQVRTVVEATGVLVAGDGPRPVVTTGGGSVAEALVRAGDPVGPGTPLAVVVDGKGARHTVRSAAAGAVTRIAAPGTPVGAGGAVAVVDPVRGPLRALLLVGPDRAGALAAGQAVRVGLPGGVLDGTVRAVAPYPATADELWQRFGDSLVAGGARRLVTVDLGVPAWPGAALAPAQAEITVAVVRPVDAVLPGGGRA